MTAKPWETEPTELHFEAHGLKCIAYREHSHGAWRGYVGVPASSPLYGIGYADVIPYPDTWKEQAVNLDQVDILQLFLTALDPDAVPAAHAPLTIVFPSHRGLSFAGHIEDFPELWFFGFDCAHAGDLVPEFEEVYARLARELPDIPGWPSLHGTPRQPREYRTLEYVKGVCERLAQRLTAYSAWPQAQELLAQVMAAQGIRIKRE